MRRLVLATVGVAALIAAALTLYAVSRPNQPVSFESGVGEATCVRVPGERIEVVGWSPDGAWLAVTSSLSSGEGRIRLIEWEKRTVHQIAVGTDYLAGSGVAVGPGGLAVWFEHAAGREGEADSSRLLGARPGTPPSVLAVLKTPAFHLPQWSPRGVVGLAFDPTQNSASVVLVRTGELESTETLYANTKPMESLWASSDGEWIAVDPREPGARPEFVVLHGSSTESVLPPGRLVGAPMLDPSRRWVVYEGHDLGALLALPLKTPGVEPRVVVEAEVVAADISDAGQLAYVLAEWQRQDNAACVTSPDWGIGR